MSQETGAWLRRERQARGWDCPEMARRLIEAGKAKGDYQMPGIKSLCHNIYRWEHGDGVSPRYVLAYCGALGIGPDDFPCQRGAPAGWGQRKRGKVLRRWRARSW